MESSEEEEDFPFHEKITPQSNINSVYQSRSEKGIRKLCCELLDLKDAVENLTGNIHSKYLAFLRLSEEVVEMEHELIELRKHVSAQGIVVQDLMSGVCRELDEWGCTNSNTLEDQQDTQVNDLTEPLLNEAEYHKTAFLINIDVLLAEHKIEEAIQALDAEERESSELKGSGDTSLSEASSYKSEFLKRKEMLENQLVEMAERLLISSLDLKKALSGLVKLGKGTLAHQLLLKSYGSQLQKSIEACTPLFSICPETYSATLSQVVFSTISLTSKESSLIFGDDPIYTYRVVQWAEWKIESFVRLVKENAPLSETVSALRAANVCVQASLSHCLMLESRGLKLSKLLMVLLRPYIEEVLEVNFRRARRVVLDLAGDADGFPLSPRFVSPLSIFTAHSDSMLIDSGMRFMFMVKEIVEQLTPLTMLHFGGNILTRISQLFDKYIDALIKALPGTLEDDTLAELKEAMPFRAETDSQQLALLGTAFTIADELLPMAVSRIWSAQNESKEQKIVPNENVALAANSTTEFKDWRRHLQHSLDKLRDHFCRQYVLNFIYLGEGQTRLDAHIYLSGDAEDLFWNSEPMPSPAFRTLFEKLHHLAREAGEVLLGKEKIQKILLARLTETVVMWLSDEQDFWGVFEDDSVPLQPHGLQQLILDMHFTVEIAHFAGYPSRNVHQIASAIIARAIKTFSARGIDPQSALPEDEWFTDTAKAAINKLMLVTSGSEGSDIDEHVVIHDEIISDSEASLSCPSTIESSETFASADMGESESPYFTDPEG
ncbi:Exocyst component Exo84, C-terminal [Dillenia turbinata]|uniref:Exocyst component Exo84, C-terminal n=1 Tax=Dillenia turbinata TaxID=194707 RepID=A0AAN8UHR3_9MAGN